MSTTMPQRLSALGRANEVRFARSRAKADLKAGRITLGDALARPELATMEIFDLLVHLPRWGRVRASRLLMRHQINPARPVGKLTDRQIDLLTGA